MFYLLNFDKHEFISCNSMEDVERNIKQLLNTGCDKDSLEIINGNLEDVRWDIDMFEKEQNANGVKTIKHNSIDDQITNASTHNEMLYLTDITGTIGQWLDMKHDDIKPDIMNKLEEIQLIASKELDKVEPIKIDNEKIER